MTIAVEITPEVQAELARQAAAHGRAVEEYAASLLEEAAHLPCETVAQAADAGKLNVNRFDNTLLEMAQFSDKIPRLPDEALTRESLYRDHD